MKPILICYILICSSFIYKISAQRISPEITIDFSKNIGKLKALNGVNNGPLVLGVNADLTGYHAEAGFTYTRLHDPRWPSPDVVDIPAIFPFFDADPDDPNNYNFTKTDHYLLPIIKNQSEIIYRLGTSIEHFTQYYIHPPKDYNKWAKICINIIRHYNEGWANGFHYNIKYWEIWNEPDLNLMWLGTHQQYFELYETAAKAIKAYDPKLKVGGPAATGAGSPLVKPFLSFCRERLVPLDFFSWHSYPSNPYSLMRDVNLARNLLDEFGFNRTENHLNEWHYLLSWEAVGYKMKDRDKWATVESAFKKTTGPEGAVFTASALMLFQDNPIDVANYYSADTNPYGMFDVFGVPSKTYYVFKAFHEFLTTPNRVFSAASAPDSSIVFSAGLSDDKKVAALFISTNSSINKSYNIVLKNFSHKGKVQVEVLQINNKQNLQSIRKTELDAGNPVMKLDLPPMSVSLVQIKK